MKLDADEAPDAAMRGSTTFAVGELVHGNLKPMSSWGAKHNGYADLELIASLAANHSLQRTDERIANTHTGLKRYLKRKVYPRLPPFVGPTAHFAHRYLLRLGFLDGAEGFAYHFLQAYWYRVLVDARLMEAERRIATAVYTEQLLTERVREVLRDLTGREIE